MESNSKMGSLPCSLPCPHLRKRAIFLIRLPLGVSHLMDRRLKSMRLLCLSLSCTASLSKKTQATHSYAVINKQCSNLDSACKKDNFVSPPSTSRTLHP